MANNLFAAKWKMIWRHSFIAVKEGYSMQVHTNTIPPTWLIAKDGAIIDVCYNHPMTKCELSARVQVERVLNEILKKNKR
jgi:hypothetical protein